MLLTRTEWGMERARRFAVSWLDDRIEGELRIGRVTGPGLLGGVIIHDFGIIDPRGRPFLSSGQHGAGVQLALAAGGSHRARTA
jgi:hypothetical protein